MVVRYLACLLAVPLGGCVYGQSNFNAQGSVFSMSTARLVINEEEYFPGIIDLVSAPLLVRIEPDLLAIDGLNLYEAVVIDGHGTALIDFAGRLLLSPRFRGRPVSAGESVVVYYQAPDGEISVVGRGNLE